ncbi:MAG TPA: ribonuclease HII [Bacteroidia bacterium]
MLKSYYKKTNTEAGCDEAGRGCLAGPVVAAAVILPPNYKNKYINDSKQIPEKLRYQLAQQIKQDALAYSVAVVDNNEIDNINILNASILAMHHALDKLKLTPDFLLIDGNRFKSYKDIKHLCVIKGDAIYMSIAAALLLAKTHRDDLMQGLHKEFPYYGWDKNKGYPTLLHRDGIRKHGACKYHRKSFTLLPPQLSLF